MDKDSQDRQEEVRERIASLLRATENAASNSVTGEELQKLKAAAGRLDEMLKAARDADVQELRNAAARLDQMLANLGKRKSATGNPKRHDGSPES